MDIPHVQNAVSLVVLFSLSVEDIFKKEISAVVLFIYLSVGIFLGILKGSCNEMILSSVPGLLVLAAGFLSGEKIGYGDGLSILALGIWIGVIPSIVATILGLLLTAIMGLFYLAFCKVRKLKIDFQKHIPFIPFLLIGMVVSICCE